MNSIIRSLEKNPVMKGIPHKDIFVVANKTPRRGEEKLKEPENRLSCVAFRLWIIKPAAINKEDLNRACRIRCMKASLLWFIPRIINIKPICLKVDKATIFLRSVSKLATNPAISIVETPIVNIDKNRKVLFIIGRNRMIRKTPAVTRVEE